MEIGALIAAELRPLIEGSVSVLLTHVEVAADDPAFENPTKPVGPFYDQHRAEALERERGWQLEEDAGRGWRRVVPSPRPLDGARVIQAVVLTARQSQALCVRTSIARSPPAASIGSGTVDTWNLHAPAS